MKYGRDSDELLMKQARAGDQKGLALLLNRYGDRLLTLIVRMIGDFHRGEEIFQEVVLTVWRKRLQYQYPKPVMPWIYKIAVNRCRVEFRKRKYPTLQMLDAEVTDPKGGRPVTETMLAESSVAVKAAVDCLPDQQRTVVILRVWNGLSFGEIAEVVGVGESTVRSNMHHALKALRASLASLGS